MYGIDISEDMKKTAQSETEKHLKTISIFLETGDCCNLPYEENMLSGVSSINTIYFWNDAVRVCQK